MPRRRPIPADVVVGERIRVARLAAGISQTELGKVCGVTFQQIQKNENGSNPVGGSRLMRIAEALKVPAASLLPSSQEDAAMPTHRTPAIRVGLEVVNAWEKLRPEHRILLRDLAHALASR